MKIWLSKRKQDTKRHVVLDMPIFEEHTYRPFIVNNVLGRNVRPVRTTKVINGSIRVRYRFNLKYLQRLLITFPSAELSDGVERKVMRAEEIKIDPDDVPDLGEIPYFSAELYDYQKIGTKWLIDSMEEGVLLTDEMGLGKTFMALAAICKMEAFPALIVCPNSAKWVWGKVAEEFSELSYQVVDGPAAQRQEQIERLEDLTIINIEGIRVKVEGRGPHTTYIPNGNPALFDYQWANLTIDEFHRAKNPTAQVTKGYHCLDFETFIGLSGTPVTNQPVDSWPTLHILDPDKYNSYYHFKSSIELKSNGKVIGYDPQIMLDLRNFLKDKSLRRRKDQVLKDLPKKVYSERVIELTREQRKLYNQIRDEAVLTLEDGTRQRVATILGAITRLKQACFSPELYEGSKESAKLTELKDIVKELTDNEEKAIIFSQWSKATRIIQRELEDYNPAYVDGSVPGKKRMKQVDKFNNDESCQLYIGTIGANREAITLSAATYVIFTDLDWVPMNNEQAIARSAAGGLRGVGVEGTVNVIEIQAKDTIEERIKDILRGKRQMFERLVELDGGQRANRRVVNAFQELFDAI